MRVMYLLAKKQILPKSRSDNREVDEFIRWSQSVEVNILPAVVDILISRSASLSLITIRVCVSVFGINQSAAG